MTAAVIVMSILNLVLVVFVVKRFFFTGTDDKGCGLQVDATPFAKLRGRSIVLRGVLAFISTVIIIAIVWTEWRESNPLPVPDTLVGVLWYSIFYLLVAHKLSRTELSFSSLLGYRPGWSTLGRYALWAVPLIIMAIGTNYLLYLPLSFLTPRFVEWKIIETESPMIWTSGPGYTLANPMSFLLVVAIAPLFEELVRALFLTRWSFKWGAPKAILVSSLLFGLVHTDIIGAFLFGYVMCVFYIKTRSLYVPIAIHAANNFIAWGAAGVELLLSDSYSQSILAEFQSGWWVGALALVISAPWVIRFTKRHVPKTSWRVPYFAAQLAS